MTPANADRRLYNTADSCVHRASLSRRSVAFALLCAAPPARPTSLPASPTSRQEKSAAVDAAADTMPARSTSFDDLAVPRGTPVMDSVDHELRDMVSLMPGRNEGRMFSDDQSAKKTSPGRGTASAPTTLTGRGGEDGEFDSGSYYYYYSSEAGAKTRMDFEDAESERDLGESSDDDQKRDVQRPAAAAQRPRSHRGHRRASSRALSADIRRNVAAAAGGGYSIAESATIARDNMADAVASIAGRFWAEDTGRIGAILQQRARQLLPYLRRLIAHVAAFWGGVTYLRRALTAFVRVLNNDKRVTELLRRIGWGSATTLRVALAFSKIVLENAIRAYELMRDKMIPGARMLLPRTYARLVYSALRTAKQSPWVLLLGPASMTFALHAAKMPDPLWLHRKFGVGTNPKDHEPFTPLSAWDLGFLKASSGGRGGHSHDDGGEDANSLSYEYTYGTGDMTSRAGETEPRETAADSGSYYYAYDTQRSFGGGNRGLSSAAGTERMPLGATNGQDGRKNVGARTKSEEHRARGDKENDRRRSVADDGLEYGNYDDGGDSEYVY